MRDGKMICVGVIGAGYAAWLHGNAYKRVVDVPVCLKTIADVAIDKAEKLQREFGFERAACDIESILGDPEIDVLDIVTPPNFHSEMIKKGLQAGKNVICEKPLLGYLGERGDEEPIGKKVLKSRMYEKILEELENIGKVIKSADTKFFYAENFIYAPPLQKIAEIISKRRSKILFIKALMEFKGSSSPVAGEWAKTGGGSFARNGVHPLAAILWFKKLEAEYRGEEFSVKSVSADMTVSTECLDRHEHRHIAVNPIDVEDNAVVTLKFSDGTGAMIYSSDTCLGGSRNLFDVYCNDAAFECKLTSNNILKTYFLDEEGMDDINIAEMLPSIRGWNSAFICDDVLRGYSGELQHFMESIVSGSEAITNFDLASLTTQIIYAAYKSAEEGLRIKL